MIASLFKFIESKLLGASWRTSVAGWVCLLAAIATSANALLDGDEKTQPSIEALVAAAAGVGLLKARDNRVSSEKAGA